MRHFTKTLIAGAIATAATAGASAPALAEVSANIGVTSNYLFRGVTQTDDKPAIQGGVDYAHESGFYLGTWTSNVDFGTADDPQYEIDFYGGYGGEVGDFGYDVGLIYYAYPDTDDADFTELYVSGSFMMFTAGLAYTIASDVDEPGVFVDGDMYYYVGAGFDLPQGFSLGGTIGYYDFDDDGDAAVGDVSYTHYQVDLGKSAGDFGDFTLTFSKAEEESGNDDLLVAVSWGKSF